jgi:GT2 family glycosyltransferase
MASLVGLTIAVCTRNRVDDLERCARSVSMGRFPADVGFVEFLLVDDSELAAAFVESLRRRIETWGGKFAYTQMHGLHGLYNARLAAIASATGEIILFLDDDVEVAPEYLARLVQHYRQWPETAGVGGIDVLTRPRGLVARFYGRLFLLDSGRPGRLSSSAFNGSMWRWGIVQEPFQSDFLSGCNMSFRRRALTQLAPADWLDGYSQGEDVYLSQIAGRTGPLRVDPTLQVRHHRSQTSRPRAAAIAPSLIRSLYNILRVQHAKRWQFLIALRWTTLGLFVRELVRPNGIAVGFGYLRGLFGAKEGVEQQDQIVL